MCEERSVASCYSEDNMASIYTAKQVQVLFHVEFRSLPWTPQLPDQNIIEFYGVFRLAKEDLGFLHYS